jgi:hypothetical protein
MSEERENGDSLQCFVGWLLVELERHRDGCYRAAKSAREMKIPCWVQSWCAKEEAYREVIDLIDRTQPANPAGLRSPRLGGDKQDPVVGILNAKGNT